MSLVAMLMIGGWIATLSMIGLCALNQSGKLRGIRKRIALWLLKTSTAPVHRPPEYLQPEPDDAV